MLCVRLCALTSKPTAHPGRCQAFSEGPSTWHEEHHSYLQNRGIQTKIQNTKSEKLRDNFEVMERQLSASSPVCVFWKGESKQDLQVLLEDSTVLTFTLDEYSGSVTKIVVDTILDELIPHSGAIVSCVRALGYFAAGLTNKQLVFIQHRKNVMLSEAKKSSDLVSTMYADSTDVIREIVLDEGRKLLITNSTKQFNVCSVIADKKAMALVELDKYVPSSPKFKTRFPKFSVLHNDTIYSIEERPNECIELQVFMLIKRKLKLQNSVKMPYNKNNEIQLKCGDLSTDESVWALGFSDGTIIVYNLTTGGDKVVNSFAKGYVAAVKWNKTSSVLLVCYREGAVFMLDRALQPLCFIFDDGFSTFMLDLPTWLGKKLVKLISAAWASDGDVGLGPFSSRASSKGDTRSKDYECAYETVAVAVHGGPIVLMRVELGAFNKGKLSNSVVLSMRLNNLQIQESLEILLLLSSNTEFYLCFSRMVDFLLKVDSFDPYDYLELLFEKCWHLFIDQKSKFLEPARNLYIRYVNRLIKEERFEAAFKAAVQIDTPEMFMQLRMCARSTTPLIAEAATLRLQAQYNVYNSFNMGLLKKIIDDANKFQDSILDQGLQLETQGRLAEARSLYIAHGRVEEERRVNLVAQFVPHSE